MAFFHLSIKKRTNTIFPKEKSQSIGKVPTDWDKKTLNNLQSTQVKNHETLYCKAIQGNYGSPK
jgi:hypothetical protein